MNKKTIGAIIAVLTVIVGIATATIKTLRQVDATITDDAGVSDAGSNGEGEGGTGQ